MEEGGKWFVKLFFEIGGVDGLMKGMDGVWACLDKGEMGENVIF